MEILYLLMSVIEFNTTHGKKKIPFNIINKRIQEFQNACEDLFTGYELDNLIPSKETFKKDFNIKIGRVAEKKSSDKTFFELYDDFVKETSLLYQWTEKNRDNFKRLKDENKLSAYQYYLQDVLSFKVNTIQKQFINIRRFLRWSIKKGFNNNNSFEYFKPKLKRIQNKIIFLTTDELTLLREFKIPADKKYLENTRNCFLFLCFTGLRYSDAYNLKTSDVKENHIEIVTNKTVDSLIIELNNKSKAILDKYKDVELKNDKVLPFSYNAKMNNDLI